MSAKGNGKCGVGGLSPLDKLCTAESTAGAVGLPEFGEVRIMSGTQVLDTEVQNLDFGFAYI